MNDFIMNGAASGPVAQRLLKSGMNVNTLRAYEETEGIHAGQAFINVNGQKIRTNASTLRKDEWKTFDQAVLMAARERLVGVADLNGKGLTYNIPNGLGTTVLEYEDMSDMEDANLSMDGKTRGEKDRPEFDIKYLPLPITHKDFQINSRVLAASRTVGQPLDTTMAELAGRKVAEKIESMLFTGASSYTFGGGSLYGYQDYTNRNTTSLTNNWDDSAATGETIVADVLRMKAAAITDRFYGPYVLYVPTNFETALDEDFKSNSDKTVRQRLMEINNIMDVKVGDSLSADNVVLVQMTSDVIRMVNGMGITVVEWSTEGDMVHNFKVMAIQVPQIRADQEGRCGIVHAT